MKERDNEYVQNVVDKKRLPKGKGIEKYYPKMFLMAFLLKKLFVLKFNTPVVTHVVALCPFVSILLLHHYPCYDR